MEPWKLKADTLTGANGASQCLSHLLSWSKLKCNRNFTDLQILHQSNKSLMALITSGNKHRFYFINKWSHLHGHFILHLQTEILKMFCYISLRLRPLLICFSTHLHRAIQEVMAPQDHPVNGYGINNNWILPKYWLLDIASERDLPSISVLFYRVYWDHRDLLDSPALRVHLYVTLTL